MCFIAEWEETFDEPKMDTFYSTSGIGREMEMLNRNLQYMRWNLTKGEDWRCLGIPYKTRNSWLHILLPNKVDGLPELMKALDFSLIEQCVQK